MIKSFLGLVLLIGFITTSHAQSHTFTTFSPGTVTSNTAGVSTVMTTAGLTGDYLFYDVSANFVGTGNVAWSNSMQMEISNGATIIYKRLSLATSGAQANPNATALHWTGVLERKYTGGGNLTVRFYDNFHDGGGPYTSSVTNVNVTICQPYMPNSFAAFSPGTVTSNTAGVSTVMTTAGLSGDYLFYDVSANFVGTGNVAWSNSMQMEISNGATIIYKKLSLATSGAQANPNATALHWTGVLERKYIGGGNLTVRFYDNFHDGGGPYTSSVTNVNVTIAQTPRPHAFATFSPGTVTSNTPGVSRAMTTAGLTGDYLFYDVSANFVGTGNVAWSNSMQMEISNGATIIYKRLSLATSGAQANPNATALHWTGVLERKYTGGGNLTVRFYDNFHDGGGPYTSSVTNVNVTIAQCALNLICPTLGAITTNMPDVCQDAAFNTNATGLVAMDGTTNGDRDFGIEFVAFTTTPTDPYVGGTSLGTVPFGSLTVGGTTASFTGATLVSADTYEIYAILSPAPTDATCRPAVMTNITVNENPTVAASYPAFCDNTTTVLTAVGSGGSGGYSYQWSTGMSGNSISNVSPGPYTVVVTDSNGCSSSTMITVVASAATYNAGGWDINPMIPDANTAVIIAADYDSSIVGASIDACKITVNSGVTLTISAGDYAKVAGDITVAAMGSLIIKHEGSLVQVDDAASVTNNGTISVEKTTPNMAAQSFMVSGSPMTAETREAVFGSSYIVRNHVTANFVPNADVELVSGGINNWADDNGNNWLTHTGLLNPGEGYMVFPQLNGMTGGVYNQTHTTGTLTNGVVNFTMGYNGTQNTSPSMLANPYASAIDAEVFFDDPANANIDVVYFWEHNTPLSLMYPGYNIANFSMSDISLYSETLAAGVPAASGGAAPTQFIASGQGFGVKPIAGGIAQFNNAMRVTGNNDTYRSNDVIARDRIWLKVYNDTYGLGSTALIGFTETTSDTFINSEDVHRLPTPVSLYSELETGEELVVNALGAFETSDAFYLSFTTQVKETQDYRISIDNLDGVNMETASVYLIDSLTGNVTNLTEGDYTFQSGEAVYHKRFKVVFENSVLGINDSNLDLVSIYPNPTQHSITIVSPQTIVTSATIYDIRGRKVSEADFRNQTSYQIDMSKLEAAIYFVEIVTESGTVTKRVLKK